MREEKGAKGEQTGRRAGIICDSILVERKGDEIFTALEKSSAHLSEVTAFQEEIFQLQ